MDRETTSQVFHYTYSAREQEEVKRLRNKYIPRQESKLEQLRRLDACTTRRATMSAVTVGVVGALLLGLGMSLIMTDLGAILGLAKTMIPGLVAGVPGLALVGLAYPLYFRRLQKEREKVAPEVLRLTDELLEG